MNILNSSVTGNDGVIGILQSPAAAPRPRLPTLALESKSLPLFSIRYAMPEGEGNQRE